MVNSGESSFITTEGKAASPAEVSATAILPPAGTDATALAETPQPPSTGELIINPAYRQQL